MEYTVGWWAENSLGKVIQVVLFVPKVAFVGNRIKSKREAKRIYFHLLHSFLSGWLLLAHVSYSNMDTPSYTVMKLEVPWGMF